MDPLAQRPVGVVDRRVRDEDDPRPGQTKVRPGVEGLTRVPPPADALDGELDRGDRRVERRRLKLQDVAREGGRERGSTAEHLIEVPAVDEGLKLRPGRARNERER